MPETVREPEIVEMHKTPEVPLELLAWIRRNRRVLDRMLSWTAGDVPLQIDRRAMNACGLDHQWVRVGREFPHAIRSGERTLMHLADAHAEERTAQIDAPEDALHVA